MDHVHWQFFSIFPPWELTRQSQHLFAFYLSMDMVHGHMSVCINNIRGSLNHTFKKKIIKKIYHPKETRDGGILLCPFIKREETFLGRRCSPPPSLHQLQSVSVPTCSSVYLFGLFSIQALYSVCNFSSQKHHLSLSHKPDSSNTFYKPIIPGE